MQLTEFGQTVDQIIANAGHRLSDMRVGVRLLSVGGLREERIAEVTSVRAGIDMSPDKILIELATPVTTLSRQEVSHIVTSVRRGGSWHAYQAAKRRDERIGELEAHVRALSDALTAAGLPVPSFRVHVPAAQIQHSSLPGTP